MDRDLLSPAQLEVVDDLMAAGQPRPTFHPELRSDLRQLVESSLADLMRPPGTEENRWITKHALAEIHACESHYLSSSTTGFPGWNVRTARGSVVHKALELTVAMRAPAAPLVLVDHAIDALRADDGRASPKPWLDHAAPLELAELRAAANESVANFLECWPPLEPSWRPRSETAIGTDLCDGMITLRAKVDLVLGQAVGQQARSLIVDFKTGRPHSHHLDDLRFYALVQTLRLGVPPFRIAGYYLDTASFRAEDVDEALLESAARRVVGGVRKILEIERGTRPASFTEGPQCGWCDLRNDCEGAVRWTAARGLDSLASEEPSDFLP